MKRQTLRQRRVIELREAAISLVQNAGEWLDMGNCKPLIVSVR